MPGNTVCKRALGLFSLVRHARRLDITKISVCGSTEGGRANAEAKKLFSRAKLPCAENDRESRLLERVDRFDFGIYDPLKVTNSVWRRRNKEGAFPKGSIIDLATMTASFRLMTALVIGMLTFGKAMDIGDSGEQAASMQAKASPLLSAGSTEKVKKQAAVRMLQARAGLGPNGPKTLERLKAQAMKYNGLRHWLKVARKHRSRRHAEEYFHIADYMHAKELLVEELNALEALLGIGPEPQSKELQDPRHPAVRSAQHLGMSQDSSERNVSEIERLAEECVQLSRSIESVACDQVPPSHGGDQTAGGEMSEKAEKQNISRPKE